MKVPLFSLNGWECEWNPRYGHIFTHGPATVWWPSNGAWEPGMPNVRTAMRGGVEFMPRQSMVERTKRERQLPNAPIGTEDNFDGGTQGGGDVSPHAIFRGAWTVQRLTRKVERHGIAAFHWVTGLPLTRAELGLDFSYTPLRSDAFAQAPEQIPQFVCTPPPNPLNQWSRVQRYDRAHQRRAGIDAEALYFETGDAFAGSWLILLGFEAMNQLPLEPLTNGRYESLDTMLRNVTATPGRARMGEVRAIRGLVRDVLNAARVARDVEEFRVWLRRIVRMLRLGQARNGALVDGVKDDGEPFQGMPWIEHGSGYRVLSPTEGCTAVWEEDLLIADLGIVEEFMHEREVTEDVTTIVRKWFQRYENVARVPGAYGGVGLPKYIVTSRNGRLEDELHEGIDPGLLEYSGDALAVAERLGVKRR